MITHHDMVVYRNIGTYHLVVDDFDGEYRAEKHYVARHFSGLEVTASSIKECQKCLDDFEVTARQIREAINLLTVHGYRVSRDEVYKDTSDDPNGLNEYAKNYVIL